MESSQPLHQSQLTESISNGIEDPMTQDGSHIVFDRDLAIELRKSEMPSEPGLSETCNIKVAVRNEDSTITKVALEISSENDLFFHYTSIIDATSFAAIKEEQGLLFKFDDFSNFLNRMLSSCIREARSYLVVFFISKDGSARMEFIENFRGCKFIELLSLPFEASHDDVVRANITYRYNSLRARNAALNQTLVELKNIVKLKLPSLHQQLERRN